MRLRTILRAKHGWLLGPCRQAPSNSLAKVGVQAKYTVRVQRRPANIQPVSTVRVHSASTVGVQFSPAKMTSR